MNRKVIFFLTSILINYFLNNIVNIVNVFKSVINIFDITIDYLSNRKLETNNN